MMNLLSGSHRMMENVKGPLQKQRRRNKNRSMITITHLQCHLRRQWSALQEQRRINKNADQIDEEHAKEIADTLDWIRNGNISDGFDEYSTSSGPGISQPMYQECLNMIFRSIVLVLWFLWVRRKTEVLMMFGWIGTDIQSAKVPQKKTFIPQSYIFSQWLTLTLK